MSSYVGKRRRPEPTLGDVLSGRHKIPEWQITLITLGVVLFVLSVALWVRLGV